MPVVRGWIESRDGSIVALEHLSGNWVRARRGPERYVPVYMCARVFPESLLSFSLFPFLTFVLIFKFEIGFSVGPCLVGSAHYFHTSSFSCRRALRRLPPTVAYQGSPIRS